MNESTRTDKQLLGDVRRASKGIRVALEKMELLAAERNVSVVALVGRGHSLRSVARDTDVSVQALAVGVRKAKAAAA